MDTIWIETFICIEKEGDFGGPRPSVNKVAVEEVVVGGCGVTVFAEYFQDVVELSFFVSILEGG